MGTVLNKKAIGIVLVNVVVLGVLALVYFGSPFNRRLNLKARFLNVAGLRKGAEVRLAGVPLGEVTKIDFLPPSQVPTAPRVEVSLSLPQKISGLPATERIRSDSTASIQTVGLNRDDVVVNIEPGSAMGQPVTDWSLLPASGSNTVSDLATGSGDFVREFSRELRETKNRLDEMQEQLEKTKAAKKRSNNSSTPSPSPGPTPDYNKILDQFEPGVIVFDPPSKMTVGTRERVMVRLAKAVTPQLSAGITNYADTKVDIVEKMGATMKVQLKGEKDDFAIDPISHEEQVVSDSGVTEWTWNVTPNASGTHKLMILVTIVLGDKQKDYPAYQKEVLVSVNPLFTATRFVGSNWQALTTLVLGSGLTGGIVAWRKRRKQNRPPPPWQAAQ